MSHHTPATVHSASCQLAGVKFDKPILAMATRKLPPHYKERDLWVLADDCSVCRPRWDEPCAWIQLAMHEPASEDTARSDRAGWVYVVRLLEFFVTTSTVLRRANECFIVVCLAYEIGEMKRAGTDIATDYTSGTLMLSFDAAGQRIKREWLSKAPGRVVTMPDADRQIAPSVLAAQRYPTFRAAVALQEDDTLVPAGARGARILTACRVGSKVVVTSTHIVSRGLDPNGTFSVTIPTEMQLAGSLGRIKRVDWTVESIRVLPDGMLALCLLVETRRGPRTFRSSTEELRLLPLICALPLSLRMQDTRPVFHLPGGCLEASAGLVQHWKTRPLSSRWRIGEGTILLSSHLWNTSSLLGAQPLDLRPWWLTGLSYTCMVAFEPHVMLGMCREHGLELVLVGIDIAADVECRIVDNAVAKMRQFEGTVARKTKCAASAEEPAGAPVTLSPPDSLDGEF